MPAGFKIKKSHVVTLAAALVLALPFAFGLYRVEGGSMEPTLAHGSVVLVERLSRFVLPPMREEIFVIRNPHNRAQVEVKRVIGLPKEDVAMGVNNVTIVHTNGVAETYGPDTVVGQGSTEFFRMQLGPHDYFVLGDNRAQSSDSREFGAVQQRDIIGRVVGSW